MAIEIVPFHDKHSEGVISVILPIQREEFGISITLQDQPDLVNIPAYYQKGKGNFWVALADGNIIGTVSLLDIGNNQSALRKMFVKSAYRGAEFQVARRLLNTVLDWCRMKEMHEIYLGTTAKFLAAHRFYEKHRFMEIPKSGLPPAFPVMAVDTKFYCYSITP